MPSLTFVLPHWLYWAMLLFIPLLIMGTLNRRRTDDAKPQQNKTTLGIAYLLWLTGGFIGLHRFYLKSFVGWIFIPLFIGILFCNVESRTARDEISRTHNDVVSAEFLIERAQKRINEGRSGAEAELAEARQLLSTAETEADIARANIEKWENYVQMLAIAIIVLMLIDAIMMPKLYRRCLAKEAAKSEPVHIVSAPGDLEFDGAHATAQPPISGNLFSRFTNSINEFTGNFVAYWSIIAVFVYYYEVVARYVFNSPTNWAHESMFLMFGMQYLLAGGYVLRHNGHVRVDVFYMHFSTRAKALVDVLTSTFFFIFAVTLLWSGWIFFMDSYEVWEVSFTEWAIQYWPVKLSIPIGAALLLLQGLVWLMNDIAVLMRKEA